MRSYIQWLAKQDCVFPMFEPACQYVTMKAAHRVENSGENEKNHMVNQETKSRIDTWGLKSV